MSVGTDSRVRSKPSLGYVTVNDAVAVKLSALSVLGFHDAVELFCELAAEHQSVETLPKRPLWEDYVRVCV